MNDFKYRSDVRLNERDARDAERRFAWVLVMLLVAVFGQVMKGGF